MEIRVYSFTEKEANSGKAVNVNQIQSRVSETTGVSLSTLKRILKGYEHNKRVGRNSAPPPPKKKSQRGKLKLM
jgi:signal recognition particle GTPase